MSTEQYFLIFLATKTSLDQFGEKPFAKQFLYVDIHGVILLLNPPPLDLIPPNLAQSYCDPPLFVRGWDF